VNRWRRSSTTPLLGVACAVATVRRWGAVAIDLSRPLGMSRGLDQRDDGQVRDD
jgi:hypothetical protein